jgi:hyperosmotically inducible periplasmic protein
MNKYVCAFLPLITIGLGVTGCGGAKGMIGENQPNRTGPTAQQSPTRTDGVANNVAPTNTPSSSMPSSTPASRSTKAPPTKLPSPQIGSGGNDFFLFTQVRAAINSEPELKGLDIALDIKEGVATMSGTVATPIQKARAEQVVRDISGVKSVNNQLRVSRVK